MKIATATEPESKVTVELVKRVSRLVAKGIRLKLILTAEQVDVDEYKQKLREYPELAAIQARAICNFLEDCIDLMFSAKNPGPNIRWWLETVYPDIFGKSRRADELELDELDEDEDSEEQSPVDGEEVEQIRATA